MFQFRTYNVRTRTKKRRYTLVVLYVCIERKVWQWSKGREAKCIPEAPLSNGVQVQLQPNLSIRCCLPEDWEWTFVNINCHSICPYTVKCARTYAQHMSTYRSLSYFFLSHLDFTINPLALAFNTAASPNIACNCIRISR